MSPAEEVHIIGEIVRLLAPHAPSERLRILGYLTSRETNEPAVLLYRLSEVEREKEALGWVSR